MNKRTVNIKVDYLTRIEGHGNIVINVREGKLETCRLDIVESPRFFEGILRGRSVFEAQHITSRICGICSCGHSLASIQAAEAALGVVPTPQTTALRKLLLDYEMLDSHLLHIYVLVAPDLLGVPSIIPLLDTHNKVVRRALRMKKACNDLCDILVGRHVHPISAIVGGFTKLPGEKELETSLNLLLGMRPDMAATLELLATLQFPEFERETEYVGLVSDDDEYPMLIGDVGSTDDVRFSKEDYRDFVKEFIVSHSSAKHSRMSRESLAVGALARFNLNHEKLHPKAAETAKALGLKAPCVNPYLNTAAQAVEAVHCLEHAIEIVEKLREQGVDKSQELTVGLNERGKIQVKAGRGVGAVEVPRGLLIHDYEVNEDGILTAANCIIPTNQNVNNIERDMEKMIPEILNQEDDQIRQALEMLVRSYDPCISCSVHMLKVDFINR